MANVGTIFLGQLSKESAALTVALPLVQNLFSAVPLLHELVRGTRPEDAAVGPAGELNARDVARGRLDAVEVPDGLGHPRILVVERALARGDGREPPHAVGEGDDVVGVDHENITRLGGLDTNRAGQVVVPCRVRKSRALSAWGHGIAWLFLTY